MSLLYFAAQDILRLWKDGYLTATGHAGATVEVVKAMETLKQAMAEMDTEKKEQFFRELPC